MTTVYPGYIRTAIHDASKEQGMGLEGAVPAEDIADAGRAFARAALSEKPIRDLATTRSGTVNYAVVRLLPARPAGPPDAAGGCASWPARATSTAASSSREFGAAMRGVVDFWRPSVALGLARAPRASA